MHPIFSKTENIFSTGNQSFIFSKALIFYKPAVYILILLLLINRLKYSLYYKMCS